MNVKESICQAFCGALKVSAVPAGYAVTAGFESMDGDHITFYVVGPKEDGFFVIQDDGMYMAYTEANGGDLTSKTRAAAFEDLRAEYGVRYDPISGEFRTDSLSEAELGNASMRFLAFLMRIQDLALMSVERAVSTFKEEAMKMLRQTIEGKADVIEKYKLSEKHDVAADVGIVAPGRPPVALFFALSESRVLEALLAQADAERYRISCSVMTMLETDESVGPGLRRRIANRLDGAPIFRGDERAACERVLRAALGPSVH